MQVVFLELCSSRVAILAPQNLQVPVLVVFFTFCPVFIFYFVVSESMLAIGNRLKKVFREESGWTARSHCNFMVPGTRNFCVVLHSNIIGFRFGLKSTEPDIDIKIILYENKFKMYLS